MGPARLWKWPYHYDVIYILKTGETDWMMISTGNSFQDGQNIDILAQNKWSEINLHKELTNNEALLWPPKQLSLLSQTDRWDWDQLSNFLSKYCKLSSKCSFIHDYARPTYRQKTFSTIQTLNRAVLQFLRCFYTIERLLVVIAGSWLTGQQTEFERSKSSLGAEEEHWPVLVSAQ